METRSYINAKRKDTHLLRLTAQHDFVAFTEGGVGAVFLNREHKDNMLSDHFTTQVRRGIESMYLNSDAKIIYVTSKGQDQRESDLHIESPNLTDGHVFSHGTDFRQIMYYKKNKQPEKIARYLENLYGL